MFVYLLVVKTLSVIQKILCILQNCCFFICVEILLCVPARACACACVCARACAVVVDIVAGVPYFLSIKYATDLMGKTGICTTRRVSCPQSLLVSCSTTLVWK